MLRKQQIVVRHLHRGRSNDALDGIFSDGFKFRGGVSFTVHKIRHGVANIQLGLGGTIRPINTVKRDETHVLTDLQHLWIIRSCETYSEINN
jgi:hypothetical protein